MSTAPSHKLSHLPLRPSTLSTLERRGFVSTGELEESKRNGGMSNLATELGCSLAEAASLIREVEGAVSSCRPEKQSLTALSLISKLKATQRTIVTFSRSVDKLLGGGLARGEVTEICGLPGVGKTQLCMQLCADARLPVAFGGVAGESVYIDTEGSFSPERCHTMAQVRPRKTCNNDCTVCSYNSLS
jgi:RAD51-like protein 2